MDFIFTQSKHVLFSILVGALVIFLFISYLLFVRVDGVDSPGTRRGDTPSGTLFLSLKEKGSNILETYTLSVGLPGAVPQVFRPREGQSISFASFDGGVVAAIHLDPALLEGLTDDVKEKVRKTGSQVYLFAGGARGLASKQVSDSTDAFKRLPKLSPDGSKLVYNAYRGDELEIMRNVEDWSIALVDLTTGEESIIGNGMFPQWLDNGHIAFMDNAGIGVHTLEDGSVTRLLESGSPTVSVPNMMFDVSDDGTLLAWTQPDRGALYLYTLDRENDFAPTQRAEKAVHGFWPQISPDGRYVAIQSVDWANIKTDPKPSLLVYRAEDLNQVSEALSLDAFVQDAMFMTDWQ